MEEFKPYVPDDKKVKEFSARVIVIGAIFGVVFGSANAYLGLRVGLTISTSIPVAVMSVALLRMLKPIWGSSTILEHNISQTVGSASSSLASGIIFTIPALFLWGLSPSIAKIGTVALLGGVLGVLFMIPLRRFLIVKEHGHLPYPEGMACGEVLKAADLGGSRARQVFVGLGIGALYKGVIDFLHLWPHKISLQLPIIKKAVIGMKATPALLGVGYILGFRISAIMVAGGLISWLVLIPMIAHFGEHIAAPMFPETIKTIAEMSPSEIWTRYIRHIGAGAVAFAGIITVLKSIRMMYRSLKIGLQELRSRASKGPEKLRTDKDLSMSVVFIGVTLVILTIIFAPNVVSEIDSVWARILTGVCIAFFSFMFVTVSSRIVGLVGVTSNPTSGMTIVTLLGTSLLFYLIGWTDISAMATALTIGTVVAISASIAGDTSQDLKTGYIVGATPAKQQVGEIIGVITCAFFIAAAVWLLGEAFGFGTDELPAPQATLMKTVVEGVLQANLPWGLVLIGAALAAVAELLSVPSLPFAVGIYLPLNTMTPVFVGGCIRKLVRYLSRNSDDGRQEQGVLLSSGLIAGEGLMGVAVAFYAFYAGGKPEGIAVPWSGGVGSLISLAFFALLGYYLFRISRKKA